MTDHTAHAIRCLLACVLLLVMAGCVRRTMKITTTPSDALVYVNDQEVGRSDVATDFLWYGDYDIVIRKSGYETLQTNWVIKEPWYQMIPLDFFFEVVWPGELHDVRSAHYTLVEKEEPSRADMLERAEALRKEATTSLDEDADRQP
ncbi:MAG: PEGA domain-containing protein [Phycisphaerae bacterium]